ncbi:hypothetical protein EBT25_11695 [bacterium]|nr:hypothetical protein [bacterium]
MTQEHPITPPPELVRQWLGEFFGCTVSGELSDSERFLATRAAQWGADKELLACGNYLKQCAVWEEEDVTEFYNYRRPKPPSLKEQALKEIKELAREAVTGCNLDILERAIKSIPD